MPDRPDDSSAETPGSGRSHYNLIVAEPGAEVPDRVSQAAITQRLRWIRNGLGLAAFFLLAIAALLPSLPFVQATCSALGSTALCNAGAPGTQSSASDSIWVEIAAAGSGASGAGALVAGFAAFRSRRREDLLREQTRLLHEQNLLLSRLSENAVVKPEALAGLEPYARAWHAAWARRHKRRKTEND